MTRFQRDALTHAKPNLLTFLPVVTSLELLPAVIFRWRIPPALLKASLEAEVGIEPTHDGFANHCLTTWLLRRALGAGASDYVLAGRVSMPGIGEIDI